MRIFLLLMLLYSSCLNNKFENKIKKKANEVKVINSNFQSIDSIGYYPKEGFIKSDSIAVEYAYIILKSIYGAEIENQLPFDISLFNDSLWIIEGTLINGLDGGTAKIILSKKDGSILHVSHSK